MAEISSEEIKLEENEDKVQNSPDAQAGLKLKIKVKPSSSDSSLNILQEGTFISKNQNSNGDQSSTSVKKDISSPNLVIYNIHADTHKRSPVSSNTNSPTNSSPHHHSPKLKIRIKSAHLQVPTVPSDKQATEQPLDGSEPYCVCRSSRTDGFMICCDICELWCHGDCVGLFSENDALDIEEYHCPKCELKYGTSLKSKQRKSHRKRKATTYNEDIILLPEERPIKAYGSFEDLLRKTPFCTDNPIRKANGKDFNFEFLENWGFRYPILLENKEEYEIQVPPPDFTVNDVLDLVGKARILDVIDVSTQSEVVNPPWSLGEWVRYFNSTNKEKIYNVISLEVSGTKLEQLVQGPKLVRETDWIDQVWPKELKTYPKVQRYCLMSVAGSYTDFHIDFGGSSVWYHLISGQKLFLFIEPSPKNLKIYKDWANSPQQGEVFLAEKVDKCYLWLVHPGQTLFIPTGWIHAVYTPIDSLVFGGNFLHSYHIKLQLDIYDIELETGVPAKFRFPLYEEMMWYAALHFANILKKENHKDLCSYEFEGVLSLIAKLYNWLPANEHLIRIPPAITDPKLLLEELSGLVLKQQEPPTMLSDEQSWNAIIEENKKALNPIPVTDIIQKVLDSHANASEYKKQQNLKFYSKLKKEYELDLLNPKFKRQRAEFGLDYLEEQEELAEPQGVLSQRAERLRKRKIDSRKKRSHKQSVVEDDELEEYSDKANLSEASASESEGHISEPEDIIESGSEPEAQSTSSEDEAMTKTPRKAQNHSSRPKRSRNTPRETAKRSLVKAPELEEEEINPLKSQPPPNQTSPKSTATPSKKIALMKAPPPVSARERLAKKLGMKFKK